MTHFNKNWNELTAEEENFATGILAALLKDVDNAKEMFNGDLKETEKFYDLMRQDNKKTDNGFRFVIVAFIILFLPIGIALGLFYWFKFKEQFDATDTICHAYLEIVKYEMGVTPDGNWGNKIRWTEDNFGDVLEKSLGLRSGTAVARCLDFLWDHQKVAQNILALNKEVVA